MRRRYYGNKLPQLPSMPLVCPEQSDAYEKWSTEDLNKVWVENGKSHEGGQNYEDGKEYNYWFVSPNDLVGYNFGTSAAEDKPIDVNIIEYFNKRRKKDGLYCYSCTPKTAISHLLPNYGSNYTIFETINGKRKRVEIDATKTTHVDNSNYTERNLIIGMSYDGTGTFAGNIYYMRVRDKDGNIIYNIESKAGVGLIETVNSWVLYSSTSATDEYTSVNGRITTSLEIPNEFSVEAKCSCSATSIIFGLGKIVDSQRNKVQIAAIIDSNLYLNFYANTISYLSLTEHKKYDNEIFEVRMVCNPNSSEDRNCILKVEDRSITSTNNFARVCRYDFTQGSTQRVVIVNSLGNVANKPQDDAVWIYTGLAKYIIGLTNELPTLKVIHRNPNIMLDLSLSALQNINIVGGLLLKNIEYDRSSFYDKNITSLYIYNDSRCKLNIQAGITDIRFFFYNLNPKRVYVDTEQYLKIPKVNDSNGVIELGHNTHYLKENGLLYYKHDDNNYTLVTAENKWTTAFLQDNKLSINDNCVTIECYALLYCLTNCTEEYIIPLKNIKRIADGALFGIGGTFLGTKQEEGKNILEIDTSISISSSWLQTQRIKADIIRFSNTTAIQEYELFDSFLALGTVPYNHTIDIFIPKYIKDYLIFSSYDQIVMNKSRLGTAQGMTIGNRYINTNSPVLFNQDIIRMGDIKIWIGSDVTANYECEEPLEEEIIDEVTYTRYKSVYYNDGDNKYLVYHAPESGETSFTINEGYFIMETSKPTANNAIFAYHPTIRELNLTNSELTTAHRMCEGWNNGGTIYLPKGIEFRRVWNGQYLNDYIGGDNCAKDDGAVLNVYMPKDLEAPIRYATKENGLVRDIFLMQTHELEAARLVLHVPAAKEEDYINNGWSNIKELKTY